MDFNLQFEIQSKTFYIFTKSFILCVELHSPAFCVCMENSLVKSEGNVVNIFVFIARLSREEKNINHETSENVRQFLVTVTMLTIFT